MTRQFLTPKEIAALTGYHMESVRRILRNSKIFKPGKRTHWLVPFDVAYELFGITQDMAESAIQQANS